MKTRIHSILGAIVSLIILLPPPSPAQGTAFTYQGRLNDGANAANGIYDLRFAIYDSTNLPGVLVAGPLTNSATLVSNGLFTVALDFGAGVFAGADRWLEIAVRTNGAGAFTTLTARQNITPAPYAISAANLGGALHVETNNTNGAPNVVGGSPLNQVDPGFVGSVIAGGGATNYYGGIAYSNRVAGNYSAISGGFGNVNQSSGSVISGGALNQIQTGGTYSGVASGFFNLIEASTDQSFIGGGYGNSIRSFARSSAIGGGELNTNGSAYSVIAGGQNNVIEAAAGFSAIGGGWLNYIQSGADQSVIAGGNAGHILSGARESFIGGGFANVIQTNSANSFIGGGGGNTIGTNSSVSTIAGGANNSIRANSPYATIAGGVNNTIDTNSNISTIAGGHDSTIQSAAFAFIGGGGYNVIQPGAYDSVIAGGGFGMIENDSHSSVIGGGGGNVIQTNAAYSFIGGGLNNSIQPNAQYATIGGGVANQAGYLSTVGGGQFNVLSNAFASTIGGGVGNGIGSSVQYGTIGGGNLNQISQFAHGSTIAGGWSNAILFNVQMGAVGGGFANVILNGGDYSSIAGGIANSNRGYISVIGGGDNNNIEVLSDRSVIGGGGNNRIKGSQLFPVYGTIGGGQFNLTQSNSIYPTIGGGLGNTVQTNAQYATIPGGLSNLVAGAYSFAAGQQAQALHTGSFVWGDSQSAPFASTANDQFSVRAQGGARFVTGGAGMKLDGQPVMTSATAITQSQLPAAVVTNNNSTPVTLNGTFSGSGSGLTGLNGNNIASGTVSDARLSANVALLNANQTFTGGNNFSVAQNFNGQIYLNSIDGFRQSPLGNFYIDAPSNGGGRLAVLANGNVGIGTPDPQGSLHVYSVNNPTVVRIQSTGTPGFGRLEFVSNPQGDPNEWRPGFIQSTDNSGFTGGIAFYVNGTGVGNRFATNEVMRIVNGNVGIGTTNPTNRLQVVTAYCTGTSWVNNSDRNLKENFATVDAVNVLEKIAAMSIGSWSYKSQPDEKHIGPMAQDFHAAFRLGDNERAISTVDEGGVALAAIQGLNRKLEVGSRKSEDRIQKLEAENAELKERLEKIERLIASEIAAK